MKIVMFTENPFFFGGGERHVYQLSRSLVQEGNEIKVVTSWGENEKIRENGISVKRALLGRLPFSFIESFLVCNFAWEAASQDIVHVHGFYARPPVEGALLAKKLFKKPIVLTLHSNNPGLAEYYGKTLGKIDSIIAVSESIKAEYRKFCNSDIKVIPNGVDIELFNPSLNGQILREFYGLEDKFVVLFVGRLAEEKGIRNLMYAIPKVVSAVKSAVFLIVGDGPLGQEIHRLSEEMKISDKVIFAGFKTYDELPSFYAACDVFILPSTSEAFPLVLLEALACAKPIICANVGGTDIVSGGVISFIKDPKSPDSISRSILKAISKGSDLRKKGTIGREIAEKYSWKRVAARTLEEYNRLT